MGARLAITAAALGFLGAVDTPAVTRAQRRCEVAVAQAGKTFLARTLAALAACEDRVAAGTLPAGTDCLGDAATSGRRLTAANGLARRIRRACSARAVASGGFGGDCAEATTAASLTACIQGNHEAEAETLIAIGDTPGGMLSAPGAACQAEASRRLRAFAVGRLSQLNRCKRHPPRQLPPGRDCSDDPGTAKGIAALRADALTKIEAGCGAAALGGARFGAPCAGPADGSSLAECLASAAEAATDAAVAAEHRNRGFCGDAADAVDRKVKTLLSQMTLTEKFDQMHGNLLIAGIWHTPNNDRLHIPGFGMVDGARGVSFFAGHATTFPVSMARGATWDTVLEEQVGDAIGTEARARGASVLLAPVLNILRHPRGGRTQETYGEDTIHLGRMGAGFIRGVQGHVIANPKHFALNSIEDTRQQVDVSVDERSLREIYLPHFQLAVQQAHAASVMSAYNKVNGQYCAENVHLLHDILKGEWAFQGFVESDWILGTRSTVPSALAGLDIEMPSGVFYGPPLAAAVTAGTVPMATIDEAARRTVRTKLCFRFDTDPPVVDASLVESKAHTDLALAVARESIVLLKNASAALPLDRSQVGSIVVVGPLASLANLGDHGSSLVVPSYAITALAGIQSHAGSATITYLPGTSLSPSDEATVAAADVAIVVAGLTADDEGEGQITHGDRDSLALPGTQDQLIATVAAQNPRTIVVLEGSGALLMPWLADVPAVLMAWYPGQEGGNAIADVLFGDVNPSGKLPASFPQAEQDLPPFDNTSLAVTYGYYHGYRYLDRQGTTPLFPFGFGLSYTTFQYVNLMLAPATLSPTGHLRALADVTNTGAVTGDEIAELYVSYQGSSVDRAVKDLKSFARVHLAPGETKMVVFDVRARDLAFYDVATSTWVVEPITYMVHVGPSSADLPLSASFTVAAGP